MSGSPERSKIGAHEAQSRVAEAAGPSPLLGPWLFAAVFMLCAVPMFITYESRGVLWGDEAALALNIGPRGIFELGRPFVLSQVCPWLTMAAIKVATLVLGETEQAYRLVPLLGALTATGLTFAMTRRVTSLWGALTAMLICGTSLSMVVYASELKPYAVDAAVAAAIALTTLVVLEAPTSRVRLGTLGVVGAVGGWMSLPSLFVMAGCGIALVLEAVRARRPPAHFGLLAAVALVGLVPYYLHFAFFIERSDLATSPGAAEYWERDFAPFPPTSFQDFRWYVGKFFYAFDTPLDLSQRYVGGLVFLGGTALLVLRRQYAIATALVGAWGFALIAAMMGRYPPVGRLLLFIVPALATVVGFAVGELARSGRRWSGPVAAALVVGLAGPGTYEAFREAFTPPEGGDLKALLIALAEQRRPGDGLYLAEGGNVVVYDFYAERLGLPKERFTINDPRDFDPEGRFPKLPEFAGIFGLQRVWLVTPSAPATWDPDDYKETTEALSKFVTRYLDKCGGRQLSKQVFRDQDLFLYDLSSASLPHGEERYLNEASAD